MSDMDKRAAAEAAVGEVRSGMIVGLGTGSTAYWAIEAIGRRVAAGETIRAVATSEASAAQARGLGIDLLDMADVGAVDLTIDGADEIDERLFAIKGAGGAMTREKIVAAASARMIVVADGSKRVRSIGAAPVPVEVLPFARSFVAERLRRLGGHPALRRAAGEDYRTDGGNLVLDARFASLADPRGLAAALDALPGVVGHGLFLTEVGAAYVSTDGVVTRLERSPEAA
jgi:ribose 5-phosphate isomerase A